MQILIYYFDPKVTELFHDVQDESGHLHHNIQSPHNFVACGEILAKVVDIESLEVARRKYPEHQDNFGLQEYRGFPCDSSVQYNESDSTFIAKRCGYIIHSKKDNHFSIITPLFITPDKMKADFILYPGKKDLIPSLIELKNELIEAGVRQSVSDADVKKILESTSVDNKKILPILVSQGKLPEDGYSEYFELIIPEVTSVGTIQVNGKIDYKSRKSYISVQANQPVLKRHPEIPAIDGYDVFGNTLTAKKIQKESVKPGGGLAGSRTEENVFVAETSGVIVIKNNTLSVNPLLNIEGDVGYETGHLDFEGSINIKGAVKAGFKVKASGDIIIDKEIEDAEVEAGGSITVRLGITGTGKSKVKAGQTLSAEYIMNSLVEAIGTIEINESIVNSTVISNHSVEVLQKHGQIIGGKTIALEEINIKVSGSNRENETILEVGKSLMMELELKELSEVYTKWETRQEEIRQKISLSYGEHMMEPVKEEIEKLLPPQQMEYLSLIRERLDIKSKLEFMNAKMQEIRDKYHFKGKPVIKIQDKAYPGTIIKIHDLKFPVQTITNFARFYYNETNKSIESGPLQ